MADRQPRESLGEGSGSFKTQGYLKNEEGCLFQVAFYPIRIADERKPGKAAGCGQYAHTARRGTQHFGHQPARLPETKAPFPALPCPSKKLPATAMGITCRHNKIFQVASRYSEAT